MVATDPNDATPPPAILQDDGASLRLRILWFRAALGLATILMIGLSWPLWTAETSLPRVPFLRGWSTWPVLLDRPLAALFVLSIAGGIVWPRAWLAAVPLGVLLVLDDQHRFQPWLYQFLVSGLALAAFPPPQALACARLFLIALYVHSGLSKLDATFTGELGTTFLTILGSPLGLQPASWPDALRTSTVLLMPAGEMLVGLGLVFRATRAVALVGAVALHLALIRILGPWSLDHSTIVLVWNGAVLIEALLLFGPGVSRVPLIPAGERPGWSTLAALPTLFALILPLGERSGWCDSWPGFALYASHAERTIVLIHDDDRDQIGPLARFLDARGAEAPWRRLDLTAWSRSERGTPPYPQDRALNGLAESVASRYRTSHPVRVLHWGRAGRFSGRRVRAESQGLAAIQARGNLGWLNAHPLAPRGTGFD